MKKKSVLTLIIAIIFVITSTITCFAIPQNTVKFKTKDSNSAGGVQQGEIEAYDSAPQEQKGIVASAESLPKDYNQYIYQIAAGFNVDYDDWYNPFDGNKIRGWGSTKIISTTWYPATLKLFISGYVWKNGHSFNNIPSTYKHETDYLKASSPFDYSPKKGNYYDVTTFHKAWDDNTKMVLDKRQSDDHTY